MKLKPPFFLCTALVVGATFVLANMATSQVTPPLLGEVIYTGTISGLDPDDGEAVTRVGTAQYVSVMNPGDYSSVENLVDAIVADLQANNVSATKVASNKVRITLGSADQSEFTFGCTDDTLVAEGSLGQELP